MFLGPHGYLFSNIYQLPFLWPEADYSYFDMTFQQQPQGTQAFNWPQERLVFEDTEQSTSSLREPIAMNSDLYTYNLEGPATENPYPNMAAVSEDDSNEYDIVIAPQATGYLYGMEYNDSPIDLSMAQGVNSGSNLPPENEFLNLTYEPQNLEDETDSPLVQSGNYNVFQNSSAAQNFEERHYVTRRRFTNVTERTSRDAEPSIATSRYFPLDIPPHQEALAGEDRLASNNVYMNYVESDHSYVIPGDEPSRPFQRNQSCDIYDDDSKSTMSCSLEIVEDMPPSSASFPAAHQNICSNLNDQEPRPSTSRGNPSTSPEPVPSTSRGIRSHQRSILGYDSSFLTSDYEPFQNDTHASEPIYHLNFEHIDPIPSVSQEIPEFHKHPSKRAKTSPKPKTRRTSQKNLSKPKKSKKTEDSESKSTNQTTEHIESSLVHTTEAQNVTQLQMEGENPKDEPEVMSRNNRRPRTSEDFYMFCTFVLQYENYDSENSESSEHPPAPQETRSQANASPPLDSSGSSVNSESTHSGQEDKPSEDEEEDEDETVEEDSESFDLVTCFCGKPFAGRAMIECSICLTWIHLSCARIKKNNIPEVFHCAICKSKKHRASSPINPPDKSMKRPKRTP